MLRLNNKDKLRNINQRNLHFPNEYFNSIFQIFRSSTCFEPHGYILRKTVVNVDFDW